jgi:hypothetical protein
MFMAYRLIASSLLPLRLSRAITFIREIFLSDDGIPKNTTGMTTFSGSPQRPDRGPTAFV